MIATPPKSIRFPMLLAACVALGACAPKDNTQASADSAAATPAAATTRDTAAMAAPSASAPAQTLTDANIVAILDAANVADSSAASIAATKGTSADVRQFANMMMGEHHALRVQGQQLAKKLNVTPVPPATDQSAMVMQQTQTMLTTTPKGADWDKAYIDHEVTYHKALLETATKALDAAQNAELKDLIKQAAPTVQKHLDAAETLQKKLSGPRA